MDKITEYVDLLVRTKVPYLDVIAYREGEEIYRYYTGREGATGNERLFMYSATKPVTAVLALRLIEEGRLSLDTPVACILPEYADVYLSDENGVRTPPKTVMTVRHLLTMTAGLSYDRSRYPVKEALANKGSESDNRAIARALAAAPLLFEPGKRFVYSLCHDVLAAVIEEVTGMPFSAYMKRTVLDPLGMTDTRFSRNDESGVADIYAADAEGNLSLAEKHHGLLCSDGHESGGAGLISTVPDYARFARALSLGGEGILSEASVGRLYTPVLSSVSVESGFTCVQGSEYGYGLGVRTRVTPTEWGLPVGEYGWDGAAGTYLMVDPVKRCAVVIGMHLRNWPAVFRGEHLAIVRRIYETFSL